MLFIIMFEKLHDDLYLKVQKTQKVPIYLEFLHLDLNHKAIHLYFRI